MDYENSRTVAQFKQLFQVPNGLYWDNGRFESKDNFSASDETADMFTNLLAGFITGCDACGMTTDFDAEPFCRNP